VNNPAPGPLPTVPLAQVGGVSLAAPAGTRCAGTAPPPLPFRDSLPAAHTGDAAKLGGCVAQSRGYKTRASDADTMAGDSPRGSQQAGGPRSGASSPAVVTAAAVVVDPPSTSYRALPRTSTLTCDMVGASGAVAPPPSKSRLVGRPAEARRSSGPHLTPQETVNQFLALVGAARTPQDTASLDLNRVAAAILSRTVPTALSVSHANGRVSVNTTKPSVLKPDVGNSQRNKRLAVAGCDIRHAAESRGRRLPRRPTATEQVGLLASVGLSYAKFNRIRVFFGAALSPMASLRALRQARSALVRLPANDVSLLDTGAHLTHLCRAVEGRLSVLWSAGLFIERPSFDPDGVAIPQTRDYEVPSNERPVYSNFCPPADMRDTHISVGLDRGGDPSSVKVVMGFMNQEHPNRLGNTILLGVRPESKDKYPEVAAILAPHVAQLHQLSLTGAVFGPNRRAVRFFINSDFPAVCTITGHKGHSASLPCPMCLGTKSSSEAQWLLDALFGTVQDLTRTQPPRTASHLREMRAAYKLGETPEGLGLATHLSVERPPVIIAPPTQIVPLPLHRLIGLTMRMLRISIEAVTRGRGPTVGRQFAHSLAATLSVDIGMEAVPYHGGNFIGRHCHTIGARSHAIVRVLGPLVPAEWATAYERGWALLRGVMSTLNRAADIPANEQRRFKADARAFVILIQESFPWVSISPKLHVLFCHSWDFMGRWGSTGLYGEQAIEPWYGFYNQNAARFTAETPLLSCRKLVQTMTLTGVASDALRRSKAPTRKRRAGPRGALLPGDRRLRVNKAWRRESLATLEKRANDRAKWASD